MQTKTIWRWGIAAFASWVPSSSLWDTGKKHLAQIEAVGSRSSRSSTGLEWAFVHTQGVRKEHENEVKHDGGSTGAYGKPQAISCICDIWVMRMNRRYSQTKRAGRVMKAEGTACAWAERWQSGSLSNQTRNFSQEKGLKRQMGLGREGAVAIQRSMDLILGVRRRPRLHLFSLGDFLFHFFWSRLAPWHDTWIPHVSLDSTSRE